MLKSELKQRLKKLINPQVGWLFYSIFFCIISTFSSCSHKKISRKKKIEAAQSHYQEIARSSLFINETKYLDIPLPIGVNLVDHGTFEDGDYSIYEVVLSPDQIKQFYTQEMERLGWDDSTTFQLPEELLFFCRKKIKACAISCKASKKSSSRSLLSIVVRSYISKKITEDGA